MTIQEISLITVIVIASFIGSIVGFGGTILAMPVMVHIVSLDVARPLLMICNIVQPIYLAISQRKYVNWKELRTIIIVSGFGIPVGIWLYTILSSDILMMALGFIMIYGGVTGILTLRNIPVSVTSRPALYGVLVLAGVFQGALLAGGSLYAMYASATIKEKLEFRATLSILWVAFYIFIITQGTISGVLQADSWRLGLIATPFLLATVGISTIVAKKISQRTFAYFVNILLFIGGIITVFNHIK